MAMERRMPSVSIVIPVYNRAKLIGRCLESIFSQGLENLEVIAVDDGSTDDSLAVMEEIAEKNACLKVLHKENGGASSARNDGIEAATGDYVMFVDSDDYLFEGSLKKGIEEAFSMGTCPDIVYFGYSRKGISGSIETTAPDSRTYDRNETQSLFIKYDQLFFGSPCFKLYRQDILKEHKLEFDVSMTQYEDAVFNLGFVRHCQSAVSVGIPVYFYDCHTNVQSKMPSLFRGDGWIQDVEKYYESMVDYCQYTDSQSVMGGGIDRAKHNAAWQVIPAIYGLYRSKISNRFHWLKRIIDMANSMIPGWSEVPQSGFPKLIAHAAASPVLCHVVCTLIFSAERVKYKLRKI